MDNLLFFSRTVVVFFFMFFFSFNRLYIYLRLGAMPEKSLKRLEACQASFLWVCWYHVYVYMYIYIFTWIWFTLCVHIHIYICICIISMSISISISTYIYMYIYIYTGYTPAANWDAGTSSGPLLQALKERQLVNERRIRKDVEDSPNLVVWLMSAVPDLSRTLKKTSNSWSTAMALCSLFVKSVASVLAEMEIVGGVSD